MLKNWCFWTVVLEKTLARPLDCKEIQPVHLKKISPGCSLEGLMLKLKLQYFGHLMRRADTSERPWCWERLRAGREGDNRGWDGWMASPTRWTWVWVDSGSWMDREAWHAVVRGVAKSRTRLSDWTELNGESMWSEWLLIFRIHTNFSLWLKYHLFSWIFHRHLKNVFSI